MPLVDLDVYGRSNFDGSPKTHQGDMAISNALVLYLTSKKGDFVNDPTLGGPLEYLLFKSMSRDPAEIEAKVTEDIEEIFGDLIQLEAVEVTPNFEARQWQFDIFYKANGTGDLNSIRYFVNASQNQVINATPVFNPNKFVPVGYDAENLLNFVILKLGEQAGQRLTQNPTDGLWYWGIYQLTNLTEADPQFNQIALLING